MTAAWRPTASVATLRARAELLALVRAFFAARGVLEVETPILGRATVTEPAIESLEVRLGLQDYYLQTSPEYAMKRLLAAGSGDIYQISRVFRAGESGRRHNPEFSLLEWYRCGFDLEALIDEVLLLVAAVLTRPQPVRRLTMHELLATALDVDAEADASEFRYALQRVGFAQTELEGLSQRELFDLAYDRALRRLGPGVVAVSDFPPAAAALARLRRDVRGRTVAARFELIVDGVEIANGYHELNDADEQRQRFEADRARRGQSGQSQPALDEALLAALAAGLPPCAGVAVGLDRLLMRKLGLLHIEQVLAFAIDRA